MRRWILAALLFLLGAASSIVNVEARAGQLVSFDGGKPLHLLGYMARPPSPGHHPAMVVLHSCAGFASQTVSWTEFLARLGYVALAVDSFQPRGITDRCRTRFQDQVFDAWQARDFLAGLPYVDSEHIGVIGFSMGGGSALALMERGLVEQLRPEKFKVAIALYPRCNPLTGEMIGPTLILIGQKDDWTPAQDCRDMVDGRSVPGTARRPADRSMTKLIVYPDAWHAYDFAELRFIEGAKAFGHWVAYDDAATRDSFVQVKEFLRRHLPLQQH
jgi:dienelactone hydrolase